MTDTAANETSEALFRADLHRRGVTAKQASAADISFVGNARELSRGFWPVPATRIPYFAVNGDPVTVLRNGKSEPFYRVRRLTEPPKGFVEPKETPKYLQPRGSGTAAYFPRVQGINWPMNIADPQQRLLVTEGEFCSLVPSLHGFPTVGLGGVYNFLTKDGALLPDLEAIVWQNRHVYIVFDSDLATNPNVQVAARRLCAELLRRGAVVYLVRIPPGDNGEKQGVDDFLKARGADALEQLLQNTVPANPGKSLILEGTDIEIADSVLRDLADAYMSRVVFCEGAFYVYRDTHWCALSDHQLANTIYRYNTLRFRPGRGGIVRLNKGRTESVLSVMRNRAANDGFFRDAPAGINCASGFIQFDAGGNAALVPHDRDFRQRHCLPGSWEPGANWHNGSLLRTLLEGCFGADKDSAEKILLIGEICGVAALGMGTKLKAPKAIVLFGPTAENGKSEVLAMVGGLLPAEAVCAVPPTRFCDQHMLVNLVGRKVNACAELGTAQAITADTFKGVITGDQIVARQLYKPAIFFEPSALHILATNVLPPFHGGFDRGVQRRLLVITFNRCIPRTEQVENIGRRITTEEAEALLAFAVEGAARVIKAGRFTEPESSRIACKDWMYAADPVLAWLATRAEFEADERVPTKDAYFDFKIWAEDEGSRSDRLPSSATFVARLLAQDGRITKGRNNKTGRFIVGLRLKSGHNYGSGNVEASPKRLETDLSPVETAE
jgi:P4 family phage/plasmid primase-like protien